MIIIIIAKKNKKIFETDIAPISIFDIIHLYEREKRKKSDSFFSALANHFLFRI